MPRDVDTAALRCFVTAVRAGSMGRAAEALGAPSPRSASSFADWKISSTARSCAAAQGVSS
jgi:hypothetical protein